MQRVDDANMSALTGRPRMNFSEFRRSLIPAAALLLAVLAIDGFSVWVLPANYTIVREYAIGPAIAASEIRELAAAIEISRSGLQTSTHEAAQPYDGCGHRAVVLEVQLYGSFLAANAVMNGLVDSHAAAHGLTTCRAGMRVSRPGNLVWGPIGGWIVFAIFLAAILLWRRSRPDLLSAWFDWQPKTRPGSAALIGVVGGISSYAVCTATVALPWILGSELQLSNTPALSRREVFSTLLPALLAIPLAEEYLFRALMLERGARAVGTIPALLYTSVVFAAIHMPSTLLLATGFAIAGIGFGVVWVRTRSLLACFVAHAVFNLARSTGLLLNLAHA